ncbi:hypothetical protein L5515_003350 [Caenorhabditis briggsae]|uniref:Uncharacterized protein n=1 Tax=Caenorhabditis briggsae TaxID=6238 RepID=A0AAE9J9I6_CAEBR|nr:hypothetical protein L5515_003350 [Caenorhabditis briggsae]
MPLIRDAASNARDNIKVCNVFTQWSRQFGDLLRKNSFSATTLFQAIEDLKTQFSEAHMSRHWLPPSITPILRLAALEIEKRDGDVTPSLTPRKPQNILERRNSIDMTLDTCISQVETISHEMDYHIGRLYRKAKDFSTFQPLDLDTVTRISKIVESVKSGVEMLLEHSFKESRPNSVMFFEITNDDIRNVIRKSDGEGSSGSLSSLKRVSAPPKIPEVFSEDEEILEERRDVEGEIMKIIEGIGEKIGSEEGLKPARNQGMISLDATVLKTLIQQSQRLLAIYESNDEIRRKRSAPPMILVENEDPEEPEIVSVEPKEVKDEQSKAVEDFSAPESPSEDVTSSEDVVRDPEVPILDLKDSEDPEAPEVVTPRSPESPEEQEEIAQLKKVISESLENSESPKIEDSESGEAVKPPDSEETLILRSQKAPEDREDVKEDSEDVKDSEDVTEDVKAPEDVTEDSEDVKGPEEAPICAKPIQNAPEDVPEDVEPSESQKKDSDDFTSYGSHRPATPEFPNPKIIALGSDLPFTLIMPEQPESPAQSMMTSPEDSEAKNPEDVKNSEDVASEEGINDDSEDDEEDSDSEKTTVLYIPSESTPQELTPQNSEDVKDSENVEMPEDVLEAPEDNREAPEDVSDQEDVLEDVKPMSNGHVLRETRSEDRMSSHLRSHINTASGKPHVTYQYPIHNYYSPPMKRRSKSEDQKIKETLKNRPPFVLY